MTIEELKKKFKQNVVVSSLLGFALLAIWFLEGGSSFGAGWFFGMATVFIMDLQCIDGWIKEITDENNGNFR